MWQIQSLKRFNRSSSNPVSCCCYCCCCWCHCGWCLSAIWECVECPVRQSVGHLDLLRAFTPLNCCSSSSVRILRNWKHIAPKREQEKTARFNLGFSDFIWPKLFLLYSKYSYLPAWLQMIEQLNMNRWQDKRVFGQPGMPLYQARRHLGKMSSTPSGIIYSRKTVKVDLFHRRYLSTNIQQT